MRNLKFEVGEIVITPAAAAALEASHECLDELLIRLRSGDWGDVSEQVRAVNERGLVEQFNLQGTYILANGQRLVVVTNGQRTLTMVHLDVLGASN